MASASGLLGILVEHHQIVIEGGAVVAGVDVTPGKGKAHPDDRGIVGDDRFHLLGRYLRQVDSGATCEHVGGDTVADLGGRRVILERYEGKGGNRDDPDAENQTTDEGALRRTLGIGWRRRGLGFEQRGSLLFVGLPQSRSGCRIELAGSDLGVDLGEVAIYLFYLIDEAVHRSSPAGTGARRRSPKMANPPTINNRIGTAHSAMPRPPPGASRSTCSP